MAHDVSATFQNTPGRTSMPDSSIVQSSAQLRGSWVMFKPSSPSPTAFGKGWLSFNLTVPRIDFAQAGPFSSMLQAGLATLLRFENFVLTPDNRTDN